MISVLAAPLVVLALSPDGYTEPPQLELGGLPPCDSDADCEMYPETVLCDTNTNECVECLGPEDCDEGWTCGRPGSFCQDACTVDADCDGVNDQGTCNPEDGLCVECVTTDDCLPAEYCAEGNWCLRDHCVPGEEFCFGGAIMLCGDDGGSTTEVQQCAGMCQDSDTGPECVEAEGSTGGPGPGDSSGGIPATDGGLNTDSGPATSGGSGTSGPSSETNPADDDTGSGCTCTTTRHENGGIWAGLLVLGALLRRRRRS